MRASFSSRVEERARSSDLQREFASLAEWLFQFAGADADFVENVLGDLSEERAARAARDGKRAAAWWYVAEALRSSPHLVASAVRGSSTRGRVRMAAFVSLLALATTIAMVALTNGNGAPARLVADVENNDGIVVNNEQAVRLPMRVLDAAGHALPTSGLRYRRLSGAPLPVSATGIAKCTQPGDAIVQVSLGALTTQQLVHCRPVSAVRAVRVLNLIVGGPAENVRFKAFGIDSLPVSMLRGQITLEDSSIATIESTRDGVHLLRARAPGSTVMELRIGDHRAWVDVNAYERTSTLSHIRPGQHLAVAVRLTAEGERVWHLPPSRESYFVSMLPDGDPELAPRLAIGGAYCAQTEAHAFWCVGLEGASVTAYYPRTGDQTRELRGTLAVERQADP